MEALNPIVIKVGSNTLVDEAKGLRLSVINDIIKTLAGAVRHGQRFLLVTSGATKIGRYLLKSSDVSANEAASVGQLELDYHYQEAAKKVGLVLGEILITQPHLLRRQQFLKLQETINYFFERQIIPLVNENDVLVSGTDWSFGDNDSLAAALAISFQAEKLIILTHLDGLYQSDPERNQTSQLITEVTDVNRELMDLCGKKISTGGRGGMISKLKSIRICTAVGIEAQIINGLKPDNLALALSGKAVGTTFRARKFFGKISNRERWLLAAKNSAGSIEVDEGAAAALRSGKSLLAVGVKKVYGIFKSGEIIELINFE